MARSTDSKKLALWQGRFQRFVDSSLPIVRFCAVEGVSEASFYYWQKKLGPQTRRRAARAKSRSDCVKTQSINARDAKTRDARTHDGKARGAKTHGLSECDRNARSEDRAAFQPVTVLPATSGVVVRLPSGTQIEVAASQLDAIRTVVAEATRIDRSEAAVTCLSTGCRMHHEHDGASSC